MVWRCMGICAAKALARGWACLLKQRYRSAVAFMLAVVMVALLLAGCTAEEGFSVGGQPELANPEYQRTPPPVLMPEYIGANQFVYDDGTQSGFIDVSNINQGYIAASYTGPSSALLTVVQGSSADGEVKDNYIISSDGSISFYPLTHGSGEYSFILYVNTQGDFYNRFLVGTATAQIESEFAPYIVPNRIVNYTPESEVVRLSHEITQNCGNDLEVVQQIYYWISENIVYDTDKAERELVSPSGYEPNLDETLSTGMGICYDYASLAAAMLRANGIPAILVKGNVLQNGAPLYHAWNLIWVEDAGWIAVELAVNTSDWTRIDVTFAAGGAADIGRFVGDGENYTDFSYH